MARTEDVKINTRLPKERRAQFSAAARVMGANMSTLLNQWIVRFIHQVETSRPDEYKKALAEIQAEENKNKPIELEPVEITGTDDTHNPGQIILDTTAPDGEDWTPANLFKFPK